MLIDTHAHLDDDQFNADRDAVIQRAVAAGVEKILCVGTTAASSQAVIHLAETYPQVYAAVGIHPNSCAEAAPGDWDRIVELLDHPRVVALGETGLDRYWDFSPIELQRDNFARHLQLSRDRDVPVIIHCRDAQADLMPMLRDAVARGPLRAVLHAFSGDAAIATEFLRGASSQRDETAQAEPSPHRRLDLYISFAGNVTYTNKKFQSLRAALAAIPDDRILIETDCPYLVPEPFRGRQRRNEPALVAHTAANLAALRGVPVEQFAAQTVANAQRAFRLGY